MQQALATDLNKARLLCARVEQADTISNARFCQMLLGNGVRLSLAEQTAREGNPLGWPRLRSASILSMILWVLVTLFGAILPNV